MQEEDYQRLLAAMVQNTRSAINANNAKSDFISHLSYELRTTLSNIMGMAQLLSTDCLFPAQRRYVSDILAGCEGILPVINRLLDVSQLEAQHECQTCVFNLKILLEKVINQLIYQADARGLQLLLDYPADIPITWIGDPNVIYYIILHLSSRAVLNTEHGSVIIHVDCPTKQPTQTEIILSIKDTSRGMEVTELFELQNFFNQRHYEYNQHYRVLNFGLALILSYIRGLKANIAVESSVGKGCKFICRIPLKSTTESLPENTLPQRSTAVIPNLNALRLLVIEDNKLTQRVYKVLLEKIGLLFDIASNAETALKYYSQYHYDLILLDIGLPDSSGIVITKIIRKQEVHAARTPIIAVTAFGQYKDQQKFLQAGIDEVLVKPIPREEINKLIEKYCVLSKIN